MKRLVAFIASVILYMLIYGLTCLFTSDNEIMTLRIMVLYLLMELHYKSLPD
jgi:hypothetical protein